MGKRIDVFLIINHVIFVLEFKVGKKVYLNSALDPGSISRFQFKMSEFGNNYLIATTNPPGNNLEKE